MQHKLDIIAQNISSLCEDLVPLLNKTTYYDDIKYSICSYIEENQDLFGIAKFIIVTPKEDWCYSFIIELSFKHLYEKIKLEFTNANPINQSPSYSAKLIEPELLITSIPIRYHVDGIAYCSQCNRIIYVDSFSPKLNHRIPSFTQLCKETDKINQTAFVRLVDFTEQLPDEEKIQLTIANVDFKLTEDLEEPVLYQKHMDENINRIKTMVSSYQANCVVVQDDFTFEILKDAFPDYIQIVKIGDELQKMGKLGWIRRAVSMIFNEFPSNAPLSQIGAPLALFMREYRCSKTAIMEICEDDPNFKRNPNNDHPYSFFRNYLSYTTIIARDYNSNNA